MQNAYGENLLDSTHLNYINLDSIFLYFASYDVCEVKMNYKGYNSGLGYCQYDSIMHVTLATMGNVAHRHRSGSYFHDYTLQEKKSTLLIKWNLHDINVDTIFTIFDEDVHTIDEGCTSEKY